MVYKFFDKKSASLADNSAKVSGGIKSMPNLRLADELYKPVIRKFKRKIVYSSFKDNIWAVDLADMQLISKCNKRIGYLLSAINLFSKYAWVVSLKDKK